MKESIVLKFLGCKKSGIKYVKNIVFSYWPKEIKSLRCGLLNDSNIYTFTELNKKISNELVKGVFCILLINIENNAKEKFCVNPIKYCPDSEDTIKQHREEYDIRDVLKKIGLT